MGINLLYSTRHIGY